MNDKEYSPAATNTGEDMVGGTVLLMSYLKCLIFKQISRQAKNRLHGYTPGGKKKSVEPVPEETQTLELQSKDF